MPLGRHTVLTSDAADRIVAALAGGSTVKDAARYGGVNPATYFLWMARARHVRANPDERDETRGPPDSAVLDLFDRSEKAIADNRVGLVAQIKKHAAKDWRAAAWMLERSDPASWARIQRVQVEGVADGAPIAIADASSPSRVVVESPEDRLRGVLGVLEAAGLRILPPGVFAKDAVLDGELVEVELDEAREA